MKILKKIIILFLMLTFAFLSVCYANKTKEDVSIIYLDDARLNKNEVKKIIYDPVIDALSKRYNATEDNRRKNIMISQGMGDIASIDKSDLLNIFKDDQKTSYIVLIQIDSRVSAKDVTENLKIVDLKQQCYLFNGRITRHTTWGSPFAILKKIAKENENIIQNKLINNADTKQEI